MVNSGRGLFSVRILTSSTLSTPVRRGLLFVMVGLLAIPFSLAHSPIQDADLSDWCVGAPSNLHPASGGIFGNRIENTGRTLTCGTCDVTTDLACVIASDCPAGESCLTGGTNVKNEVVWWDALTDGAVNDLATVATTWDYSNLYFAAELWVDPDPGSLPFGQIAVDYTPGGVDEWWDRGKVTDLPPFSQPRLTDSGRCSVDADRGCTRDADCHFCTNEFEPNFLQRNRACGSGCTPDIPGNVCDVAQTCVGIGSLGNTRKLGVNSSPVTAGDYLIVFDFSRWLAGQDSVRLMEDVGGAWTAILPLVDPAVNPGASGGSGGPPGSVEVAVPWTLFGCVDDNMDLIIDGCPDNCECPGFGPGQPYNFSMIIARGDSGLDFDPAGPIEDLMSECPGGRSTLASRSCSGSGVDTTTCEIADPVGSTDSWLPAFMPVPGGTASLVQNGQSDGERRQRSLYVDKGAGGTLDLRWCESCSAADSDYGIYEGQLPDNQPGTFAYNHTQIGVCSTGGAAATNITPSVGDRYYLVVPNDTNVEGSYGQDSSSTERPPGIATCMAGTAIVCP